MSNTPRNGDICKRLLDNGWRLAFRYSGMGMYTAHATSCNPTPKGRLVTAMATSPDAALKLLKQKVGKTRAQAEEPRP